MIDSAKNEGVNLQLNSSFRTNEDKIINVNRKSGQYHLFDIYTHKSGKHSTYPNHKGDLHEKGNLAAKPGRSNHQSGIAVDISAQKGSKSYSWLVQNAWKYGFIRAVRKERWHWEYRPNSRMFSLVDSKHKTWDDLPNKFGLG